LLVMLAALGGCADVSRFEKGAAVAFGERLEGEETYQYYLLRLDLEDDVPPPANFHIRLGDRALALDELTPAVVAPRLPAFAPPPQWPERLNRQALMANAYAGGGYFLAFGNGRLTRLSLCSHCGGRSFPVIGSADGQRFYTLPLTREQLIDVLGPPDRVYRVNEVRY